MTTEHEDSPVRHFCAQLDGYVRASGHTRSFVVSRHPMSDSQVYAVLAGTVKTPPSFDRMVVPIVEICGGDAAAVAQWRTRHDTMVRVYELQKSLRRKATVAEPAESPEPAEPAEARVAPPGKANGRSRWALLAVAVAAVAGIVAGGAFAASRAGGPDPAAAPNATGTAPSRPPAQNGSDTSDTPSPCTGDTPPPGGDMLDSPLPDLPDDERFDPWWSSNQKLRLDRAETHGWSATLESGAVLKPWDMLVIRSCVRLIAGHRYRVTFTASASAGAQVGVRVQSNRSPWPGAEQRDVALTAQPRSHTVDLQIADVTSNAGELQFQLGGNPPSTVNVSDIVLTDLGI